MHIHRMGFVDFNCEFSVVLRGVWCQAETGMDSFVESIAYLIVSANETIKKTDGK